MEDQGQIVIIRARLPRGDFQSIQKWEKTTRCDKSFFLFDWLKCDKT